MSLISHCVPPLIIFHEFDSSHLWFLAFDLAKCLFWQLLLVGAFVHQDKQSHIIHAL